MERHGSRSQKGPYARKDGRKSFFSKVKDSFRDIVYPSWLSGSDKSETYRPKPGTSADAQGSTPAGSSGGSSPDLRPFQGHLNPEIQPFPGMNMGLSNGQPRTLEFSHLEPSTVDSPFQSPNVPPPISEFTSSLLPLNRLTEKSDSVLANEDTMSQRSDASKSTSGCSSMVPQLDSGRRDAGVEKRKAPDKESPGSRSPPSPGPQPTPKRQRLNLTLSAANRTWTQKFNDTVTSQQPPGNLKRPAFNTSLFGSTLNDDSSVLGTSFHESSFYPGKTTFGGRSSFRSTRKGKVDLNQSLPSRLSFPVKSFVKAKPRVTPVKEAVTSSRAKRILDVLDRMPTPLSDAKKIPLIVPHNFTMNPSFFSKEVASSSVDPPTRRQTIGGLASISKNRQTSTGPRFQSQDNKVKPSTSSSSEFRAVSLQREETVKLGSDAQPAPSTSGKMRREKSYHKGSASIRPTLEEEDTVVISPDLRTDFTLPVSAVPKFSFGTPSIQQTTSKKNDTVNKPVGLNFTFSSPVAEKVSVNKPASPQNVGGFQFSSPMNLDRKENSMTAFSNEPKTTPGISSFSTLPKPKAKSNGPSNESSIGGFKPATELKAGSVMDILGGSSSIKQSVQSNPVTSTGTSSNVPLSALFKQTGWSCDTCLIKNKEDVDKCIACQTPKPVPKQQNGTNQTVVPKSDISNEAPSTVPLSALFKKTGWSCDVCLLNNKEDADKCVACQAPKPGPKKQTDPTSKPSLLSKNSVLPGNWVCKSCLIQNKSEDIFCGACKASKSSNTFKDTPKTDDLMAKFKPSSGNWKCEVCLIQNKLDANSCVACQSPKPLKCFKPPPGDWVCDTCLVNNKAKDVKCVACNYSRPGPPRTELVPSGAKSFSMSQPSGFSFPSTSSSDSSNSTVLSAGGFKFGTGTSSNKDGFKFGATSTSELNSKTSESGFKFGNASSDASKTTATTGFKFGTVNSNNSEKSKTESVPSTVTFQFGSINSSTDKKLTGGDSLEKTENGQKQLSAETGSGSVTSSNNVIAPAGGFRFSLGAPKDSSSTSTSTGGFQFATSTSKNSTPLGGFKFGTSSISSPSATSSTVASVSVVTNSSVVSGQALVVSSSDPVKTKSVTPGGFSLPTAGSLSSVNPLSKSSQPGSQGLGGFNSTSSDLKNSTAVTSSSFTGFSFGGTKASEDTSNKESQKPVFGGFTGQTTTVTSTPAFGGFAFAQKKDSQTSGALINSSSTSPSKRGRDDDTGETAAKKSNFNFGSTTTSSTPFQFGGSKNESKPQSNSSPFVFGQQNTATTQAGGFNFGINKPSDTAKPLFGAAVSSNQTNSSAPVFGNTNSAFSFTGQKSEPSTNKPAVNTNLFGGFGSSAAPSASPAAPTFNFSGTNSNSTAFGSGSGSAFGGNAPSTTPAFGATPPSVFGSTNSAAVTTTTPAFGGVFQFGSDKTSGGSQPTQTTNAVFQFGAKPTENTQPAAGNAGFNFNAAQAGLGSGAPNFNFSQSAAPGAFAFSPSPAPGTGERKIKRAVRKLRR